MNNRVRWRLGAWASVAALLGSLTGFQAHALGLGRITVQSALGEPLRAEIDIAEISADEAATLKAGVASPDAFKAAGLDYSTAVVEMQVTLQKRPDGRSYLRLSSARAVTEPFVDLILEANWSSGRIVRDYTMLFDPPNLRQSAGAGASGQPTAPMIPRQATPTAPSATGLGSTPYSPPAAGSTRAAPPAPAARATPPRAIAPPKVAASGQQLAVKAGDTAGKIAADTKPASISLDQMLVALLRSNPDAFIGGNINRLKSGALLDIPGAEAAASVAPAEATRTIIAQSKDFNDFRRKLAESVPSAQAGAANRQAGGKIEAKVEDRAPATATPDKLTLSKGALLSKAAAEDKIAKERQAKEVSTRVAELSKNIGDLNKLSGAPAASASAAKTPAVTAASPQPPASAPKAATAALPAVTVAGSLPATPPAPAPTAPAVTETKPATASTTATTSASTTALANTPTAASSAASAPLASLSPPVMAASQAVAASSGAASAAQAAPVKKPVAAPPPEPSLIDELTENPFVLPGFAALLVLLAGFGFYRFRQRNNATQVDSSFLESRLQPDSFFGASGGQRIDTNEGGATGSSLVYSPSQLDAAGDVDPVAEADVYLAYGRDLQAEEILKEALRTNPTRVSIHSKLMEIYAKRRDAKAFEVVAMEAFNLTRGEGPEWAYMGEMGRELDPSNPMYQPGGQPASAADRRNSSGAPEAAAAFGSSTMPQAMQAQYEEPAAAVDFDLDLDFSIGDEPIVAAPALQPPEPTLAMKPAAAPVFEGLDLDFGTGTVAINPEVSAPVQASPQVNDTDALLSGGLTFTTELVAASKPAPAAPPAPAVMDSGMLEFDLGSLSLDLDGPTTESPVITAAAALDDGPLETKFALAEEFRTLGDMDGARALAEEVLAQAQGTLKGKAQAFLNALS